MANPHFQNLILWAGNTVATEHKKNQPMFAPYPSDQTFYMYHNDFLHIVLVIGLLQLLRLVLVVHLKFNIFSRWPLLLTNAAGDNDLDFLQLKGEAFKLSTIRKHTSSRFKVSDATQSDFVMGLQITDTTPLATTDGVFFIKDDGDTNLDSIVEKDSTSTDTTAITQWKTILLLQLPVY